MKKTMHFSIPQTQEVKSGFTTYITYHIYINGTFHCSLRYRQLYHFHVQLRKAFGAVSLPDFPPKKFLPLTSAQIEERRSQLERYIQIASQDSQIVNSDIFNGFLLAAQQESHNDVIASDCIDIYRLDWQPTRLMVTANENSQIVMKKYGQTIKLETVPYFCLYLVKRCQDNHSYTLVRQLQNFESPLLTLRTMNENQNKSCDANQISYVILVHKSYWDVAFDEDLYNDPVALDIIYQHAVHDIENERTVVALSETRQRLADFRAKEDKLEYVKLARTQKYYGCIHFEHCHCDSPTPKSSVHVIAGNQELIIRDIESDEEYVFRVIRIKCWRLTTSSYPGLPNGEAAESKNVKGRFELSFEYLIGKGSLKWITIFSTQAVLISFCLQSMVEEMLLQREGKKFRSEGLALRYNTSPSSNLAMSKPLNTLDSNDLLLPVNNDFQWNYFKKDGSHIPSASIKVQMSDDDGADPKKSMNQTTETDSIRHNHNGSESLTERFQAIALIENGVFDEIGDEDL